MRVRMRARTCVCVRVGKGNSYPKFQKRPGKLFICTTNLMFLKPLFIEASQSIANILLNIFVIS